MSKSVDFYYDFGSPASYLAWARIPAICAEAGAQLNYRPMLLGGIFKLTGNAEPVDVPAKRHYMLEVDLPRNAHRHSIPLNFHSDAPFNSLAMMRGAMVAEEEGRLQPYADALFRAMWADARNLVDVKVVAHALEEAGFDAGCYFERIQTPEIKQRLIEATEAAAARGVFGAPTFFLGDEMFFGQDRLDMILERVVA